MKQLRAWKKVFINDLPYLLDELKEEVERPAVIILSGPLGAGKTTICQLIVGKEKVVSSPTYSVVQDFGKVVHGDFYRLQNEEEVLYLELGLYQDDKEYYLFEWGIGFLNVIRRELGDQLKYYELAIEINEIQEHHPTPSRNFYLRSL